MADKRDELSAEEIDRKAYEEILASLSPEDRQKMIDFEQQTIKTEKPVNVMDFLFSEEMFDDE